ncbi:ABC transporter permease [Catellatospora aurea]|uniref:ABC transporter permease n=1 Tax=Catellatospora aurea TaxID=1337874 RepID=A0ABW2HCQ5_9ACTN
MTTPATRGLRPARLNPADLARLGVVGLRARPMRVFLSALGIAIGIAAMLSVVGVTTSSRAHLDRTLQRLGTNLLTVVPGEAGDGRPQSLPEESVGMVARIGPVESVSATGKVTASVYRNDHIPAPETSSVEVLAAEPGLLDTLGVAVGEGSWFTPATATYPAVVLGAAAARRLDVPAPGLRLWLGGEWFVVVGILDAATLVPALDSAALVGWDTARTYLGFDGRPTVLYIRADERQVAAVRDVLGRTADPQAPQHVRVSRPSDALAAKQATDATLSGTLLGLGMVALLVGGVGIANTMVISVLERRAEIGLRRALGATQGQIRVQFLAESLLLSGLGGAGGVAIGTVAASLYASSQGWPVFVPAWATGGSLGAALLIGALAGLYPAVRASRLEPTSALNG